MPSSAAIIPIIRLPRHRGVFDYEIPDGLEVAPGHLAHIPFRGKKVLGLIARVNQETDYEGTRKPIMGIINPIPMLGEVELQLILEMAEVYGTSPAALARMFLPPLQPRALANVVLTPIEHVKKQTGAERLIRYYHRRTLYKHLPALIEQSENTTIIVPRASDVESLAEVFPEATLWHGTRSPKQQREAWMRVRNGCRLLIGTRSALFVPSPARSHIVLIDEESQDHKNWDAQPRYRTLDVARRMRDITGLNITICGRTPRISALAHIAPRNMASIEPRPLTHLSLVDMMKERNARNYSVLSLPLANAMDRAIERGRASFLLAQKKGFARALRCADCGYVYRCPSCGLPFAVSATSLACSHCNIVEKLAEPACPNCRSLSLRYQSPGIEQVHEECVRRYAHRAHTVLITADTIDKSISAPIIKQPAIFIGTSAAIPVIPYETTDVLGIVDFDLMLRMPEYDAAEKTLMRMNDIMYRADIREKPPHMIIQTNNPHHPVCSALSGGTLNDWYAQEAASRAQLLWPPYSKLMKIEIEHEHADVLADRIAARLKHLATITYNRVPARKGNTLKKAILIKLSPDAWWDQARRISAHLPPEAIIDIDPISMLS